MAEGDVSDPLLQTPRGWAAKIPQRSSLLRSTFWFAIFRPSTGER
jgi:hypothetical protein